MSWLSPKHLEDANRILRGVALVLAKAAIDSTTQRAALRQAQAAARAAANAAAAHSQQGLQQAAALHAASAAPTAVVGSNHLVGYLYPHTVALLSQAHQQQPLQQQQHWQHWQHSPAAAVGAAPQQAPPLNWAQQQPQAQQQAERVVSDHSQQQQQQQRVNQEHVDVASTGPAAAQPAASNTVLGAAPITAGQQQQHTAAAGANAASVGWQGVQHATQHAATPSGAPSASSSAAAAEAVAAAVPAATTESVSGLQQQASASSTHPSAEHLAATAAGSEVSPGAAGSGSAERVDSWMSGHESPTTEAEAVLAAVPSAPTAAAENGADQQLQQQQAQQQQQKLKVLRERRVPSTQIGRALGFAGMGASLLFGSITDSVSRTFGGSDTSSSSSSGSGGGVYSNFITESNAERLANALCRMRGAALKIGQMLSIQDETVLPPQIQAALERVRAGADVMPRSQVEGQLVAELGGDWLTRLASFDWTPRAAASIGQVHAAQLQDGTQVAMKIQYPGVARSIESDVDNLMRLIRIANILPKGLYVESAVKVAKRELALECNYTYEAAAQQRFKDLVAGDPQLAQLFYVPQVYPELCNRQILTTEWVNGITIDKVALLPQEVRDHVGTCLLRLTLRELYDWRFMQTDPNWGNFLYDQQTGVLNLIDFGAAKQYPRRFVDNYLRMVRACAERDRQGVVDMSVSLGFLTGDESAVMLDAHTEAGFVVGLPFSTPGIYDFGAHSGMTPRVAELGSIMLKHRLTPPPEESYSLHRKLSGAFLACIKLRARVPCRDLFFNTFNSYNFEGEDTAASDRDLPHTAAATA